MESVSLSGRCKNNTKCLILRCTNAVSPIIGIHHIWVNIFFKLTLYASDFSKERKRLQLHY